MVFQFFKMALKKYFEWRHWSYLYKNMKRNIQGDLKKKSTGLIPYINKPGIALSFDDSYRVHNWYKYGKEMLEYYDVKVTFNINGINPLDNNRELSQDEIDKLLELQANGHEIAHHGFKHMNAVAYSREQGYSKWVKDEIETLLIWMEQQKHSKTKEKFKKPVSFAFPHFVYDEAIINKLIPRYFKISRGYIRDDNLTPFGHSGFAPSICLDGYYCCSKHYLRKIIKLANKTRKNLIITCHSILPKYVDERYKNEEKALKWGKWKVTPELIQWIINEGRKNGLEFYTTSEVAGIATFLDRNLEKAIKNILGLQPSQWVMISELCNIKELDLSGKGISNLDGLQYFISLEKLNLSNNPITDFRKLKKLPNLKNIITDSDIPTHNVVMV